MRIARHFDPLRVDRGVRAAHHRPQIRSAEGKIDRLLGPSDDADALAIGGHHPDAARPGTINPADAVDLQAVGYARLRALVQVGEDAALHHVAGRIEADRMDVLRERVFATYIVCSSGDSASLFGYSQFASTLRLPSGAKR